MGLKIHFGSDFLKLVFKYTQLAANFCLCKSFPIKRDTFGWVTVFTEDLFFFPRWCTPFPYLTAGVLTQEEHLHNYKAPWWDIQAHEPGEELAIKSRAPWLYMRISHAPLLWYQKGYETLLPTVLAGFYETEKSF